MRLLHIRGAGLASLAAPFDIDLTAPIIRDTGLFMISGQTGAGKSTVLDAVMLALFDKFPRIEAAGADDEIDTGDGSRTESATAPSAILSRGLGHGYAEVEFVGADAQHYRARWEIHRARKKASGELQNSIRSLFRIDQGGIAHPVNGTKKELATSLEQALGLTYDQFMRTVLLAQNRFDAFLTADERERARLLEKITGDDIYTRISQYVHRATSEKRTAVDTLQAQADIVTVLTAEECASITAEQVQLEATLGELQTAGQDLAAAKAWWEIEAQLASSVLRADNEHEDAAQAVADLAPLKAELAQTRAALSILPFLSAVDGAQGDLKKSRVTLADAQSAWDAAEPLHIESQATLQTALKSSTEADRTVQLFGPVWYRAAELDRNIAHAVADKSKASEKCTAAKDNDARLREELAGLDKSKAESETLLSNANRLLADYLRISPLAGIRDEVVRAFAKRRDLAASVTSLAGLLSQAQKSAAEADALTAATSEAYTSSTTRLATLAREIEPLDTELAKHNLQQLNILHREGMATDTTLVTLRHIAAAAQNHTTAIAAADATLHEIAGQVTLAAQVLEDGSRQLVLVTARIEENEAARKSFELALSDDAQRLRSQLQSGEPCPVCGSKDHPRHDANLATALAPLNQRTNELAQEKTDLLNEIADAKATIAAAEKSRAKAEETNNAETAGRDVLLACWSQTTGKLPAHLAQQIKPLDATTRETAEALDTLRQELAGTLSTLSKECERLEALQNRISTLTAIRHNAQQDHYALESRWRQMQLDDAKARSSFEVSEARAADARYALQEQDVLLATLLEPMAIGLNDLASMADHAELEFTRLVDLINDNQKTAIEAKARIFQLAPDIAATTTSLEHATQEFGELNAQVDTHASLILSLQSERAPLLGGEDTDAHRNRLTAALELAREAHDQAQSTATRAKDAMATATADLRIAKYAENQAQQRLGRAVSALTIELLDKSLTEIVARELVRRGLPWVAVNEATIRGAESALAAANHASLNARAALNDHRSTPQPDLSVSQVVDELAQISTNTEAVLTRKGELAQQLKDDRAKRHKQAAIVAEIEAARKAYNTWEAVNHAIGSAEGNKFRRYAQSHTFEVLIDLANDQLRLLAPRYRLSKVPGTDLALQVVDQDMGEEIRGARSLSGGERFLVSLALALALSTLGAGKALIETLFIDEGFGSLDPESLDLALEGLDALRSQGRIVGVISHVEAMRERIPVQIIVQKQGGGRSTLSLQQLG